MYASVREVSTSSASDCVTMDTKVILQPPGSASLLELNNLEVLFHPKEDHQLLRSAVM